jgi:hypothetical protein
MNLKMRLLISKHLRIFGSWAVSRSKRNKELSRNPKREMIMNNVHPKPNLGLAPLPRGEGETGAASGDYPSFGLVLVHGFNARNFSLGEFSPPSSAKRIATCMLKGAANRTFMLVVVGETSGLPFECARSGWAVLCGHSFIVGDDAAAWSGDFIQFGTISFPGRLLPAAHG